uniref:C-type lectin domain-containing protein n=1 Tax=Knipowitschia caucasica TaxID=637954 RepID=A0AAV2LCA2_KNICA
MAQNLQLLLLLGTISAVRTKYVYVEQKKTWLEALSVCERDYTTLAPVNNEHDIDLLRELGVSTSEYILFGLQRNRADTSKWIWSGGGEVTRFFWDENQPKPSDVVKPSYDDPLPRIMEL